MDKIDKWLKTTTNYFELVKFAREVVGKPPKGVLSMDTLEYDPDHVFDLSDYPLLRKAAEEHKAVHGDDVYKSEEDSDFTVGDEEEEGSSEDTVLDEEVDEVSEQPEEPEFSARSSESSRLPSKVRTDRAHPKKHPPQISSSESNGSS